MVGEAIILCARVNISIPLFFFQDRSWNLSHTYILFLDFRNVFYFTCLSLHFETLHKMQKNVKKKWRTWRIQSNQNFILWQTWKIQFITLKKNSSLVQKKIKEDKQGKQNYRSLEIKNSQTFKIENDEHFYCATAIRYFEIIIFFMFKLMTEKIANLTLKD